MKLVGEEQALQLSKMLLQNDKSIQKNLEGKIEEKSISIIGTKSNELSNISIQDKQIIFVEDKRIVAVDINGKRSFYNEITIVENEKDKDDYIEENHLYFCINTATLWFYGTKWIQISSPPKEILFIGTSLPKLGEDNKLYVNKSNKNISIWDNETKSYICVGEATSSISNQDIDKIFRKDE